MSVDPTPIVISNNPQLLRLAEEVEATNKPRLLKRDDTSIALLTPVNKKPSSQAKRKAIKETLALAGAWGDRDWNEVKLNYRARQKQVKYARIGGWEHQEKPIGEKNGANAPGP
jgi:hypothetical protein